MCVTGLATVVLTNSIKLSHLGLTVFKVLNSFIHLLLVERFPSVAPFKTVVSLSIGGSADPFDFGPDVAFNVQLNLLRGLEEGHEDLRARERENESKRERELEEVLPVSKLEGV